MTEMPHYYVIFYERKDEGIKSTMTTCARVNRQMEETFEHSYHS